MRTSASAAATTGHSLAPAAMRRLAESMGVRSSGETKVRFWFSSWASWAASLRESPVSTLATRVRTPPALVTASTAAE